MSGDIVFLALFPAEGICFGVCPIVPSYIAVMFKLVRPTAFRTSCSVYSIYTDGVFLFLVVSVLKDIWVHVCAPNSSNILTYINVLVDD